MSKKDQGLFVAARMLGHALRDGISRSAAELAFYLLFSLFPIIMVLNSLLALIRIPREDLLEVTAVLPEAVQEIILGYMDYLGASPAVQPLLFGSALTLYFLSRAVRSMMHTFGDIYGCRRKNQSIRRVLSSLLMTGFSLVMLASSLVLIVAGQKLFFLLGSWFPGIAEILPHLSRIGILIALGLLLIFLILCYRLLPGVPMRWRDALPGAVTSLACWFVLTRCFSYYVDNMANYSLLYGSIGAVIILMLWLNLTALTLILGAEFNYVLAYELKEEKVRFAKQRAQQGG